MPTFRLSRYGCRRDSGREICGSVSSVLRKPTATIFPLRPARAFATTWTSTSKPRRSAFIRVSWSSITSLAGIRSLPLDLGIGKGYRHSEFVGFQIPQEEADARFEEAVEVITRSWLTRSRFSYRGRFWSFEDIVVEPPPAQQPHPPLWVAAGSAASIVRAARRGFNLMLDQYASARQIGERIALYRDEREGQGRPFDPMHVAVARQLYVADDRADADAALARLAEYTQRTVDVSRAPGRNGGSHVLAYADKVGNTEEHALYGTPDEIRAKLTALSDAGVEYVLLTVGGGKSQLQRFAREIMPAFAVETPKGL
jgi:alkanesulfonate monooxygenase SsuD/methylene tetrahydromethanopterin reductase-like flavin-dependent oxidoreductase (luciferase family)